MLSTRLSREIFSASHSVRKGTAILTRPQNRSIWASYEQTHKPKQPIPVHPKVKMAGSIAGWVIYGAIGYGVYNAYVSYAKKQQRLSECVEMPKQEGIKADLPLVRYQNCVLPRYMVSDGVLVDIANFELRDEDVIVASFPKSGTTWLQEVVYRLCHLRGAKDQYADAVMETKFPYLEFAYPGLRDVKERKGRRFIKTHLPYHLLPENIHSSKAKVLYISRNPKDVCTSYYHFARMLKYIDFRGGFKKFVEQLFLTDSAPYSPFFPHLQGYQRKCESDPSRHLHVHFEDMKEDPKAEIRKIAAFLGIDDLTREEEEAVAAATTFEAMKNNPLTNYSHWDEFGLRVKEKRGEAFFRKGVVGDYENHELDEKTKAAFDSWISTGVRSTGMQLKYAGGVS